MNSPSEILRGGFLNSKTVLEPTGDSQHRFSKNITLHHVKRPNARADPLSSEIESVLEGTHENKSIRSRKAQFPRYNQSVPKIDTRGIRMNRSIGSEEGIAEEDNSEDWLSISHDVPGAQGS